MLAAGASRRMGAVDKLLAELDGAPLIRRTVENIATSTARPVVAVVADAAVAAALDDLPVQIVFNRDAVSGMASSLRAGLAALPTDVDGAAVCLGDMPQVTGALLDRLIDVFDPGRGRCLVAPTHGGRRGHPVLWGREFFGELAELSGDVGAKAVLERRADRLLLVDAAGEGALFDVDTPLDLEKARRFAAKSV